MSRRGLLLGLALAACSSRSRTRRDADASAGAAVTNDAGPGLTVEAAIAQFEALQICPVGPKGVDDECPAQIAFNAMHLGIEDPGLARYHIIQEAALKVLAHRSPAVRVGAVSMLSASFHEEQLAKALVAESDPTAVRAMIWYDGIAYEFYPTLFEALVARIDDPSPEVRIAAIERTGDELNATHPTLFARIADHIAHDADPAVRASACLYIGALQDARSVPIHDQLLVATTPTKLFDACALGLVVSWLADAEKEHPVEAAYHRTLALLRRGPHRAGAPGPDTLEALQGLARSYRVFDDLAPWVDVADTRDALATFAASTRADPAARRIAAQTIADLAPTAAELRRFRARVRDRSAIALELLEIYEDAEPETDEPPP